jgi:hypothetical protein
MLKTKLIMFDSNYAVKNNTDNNEPHILPSPYSAQYFIKQPLINIQAIYLKSFEIPLCIHNCRTDNLSNTLSLYFTYSTFINENIIINVASGYYTLDSLLTRINYLISLYISSYPGLTLSLEINNSNVNNAKQKVKFLTNSTSFSLDDSIMVNEILGFATNQLYEVPNVLYAINYVNMNPDTHYIMSINNFSNESMHFLNRPAIFKIPFNNVINGVLYYEEREPMQCLLNLNNLSINKLDVSLYDKWNFPVNGYNYHFTFSLIFEYLQ